MHSMKTFKVEKTVGAGGSVVLEQLPFTAGERVEIVIVPVEPPAGSSERYPLRGTPYRFDDPTEPVASDDWEAAR